MKRILFADDDAELRQFYSRMLADDGNWEVVTVPDGPAALRRLRESTFDVVATDLQMPGMTGIDLLTEVRHLQPSAARIIVSANADQATAANALNCTHLFIPKPFEVKTLMAALDRIYSLDGYLNNEKLRNLASMMRQVPSFPVIYSQLTQEIESPYSSIQGITNIITQDPGITAKILQVANSAAFGFAQNISNPAEAVQQLGMSTVRSLALSAQVYSSFISWPSKRFSPNALWIHMNKCAGLARQIMRSERGALSEAEDAFTAGLLHDVGLLMLADSLPREFEEVLRLSEELSIPLTEAETEIFGATHPALAAYLLGLWGLPASIVEAVAFHLTPEKSDLKRFTPLAALHIANSFADESQTTQLNRNYLNELGVADHLENWQAVASEFNAPLN